MTVGNRLRLRLFLEGVEVPLISANIQCNPNSPIVCSLQIPPLEEATQLLPGTLVHLYFFDYAEASSGLISVRQETAEKRGAQDPTVYEQTRQRREDRDAEDPNRPKAFELSQEIRNQHYKLIFVGEVLGYNWTKDPLQRSIVLQCMDLSNYWDRAYQFSNSDLFGPGYKTLFSGGATNLFTDFFEDKGGAVLRILNTPSTNYPSIKGLPGGLIHLIEAIGGSYYASSGPGVKGQRDTYAGQNIFFSIAELRLHFTQMIHAYAKDDTAYRLMGPSWDSLFGRTLGGLGEQVSIRQAINAISGLIFYETYSIPAPRYVPGLEGTVSGYVRRPAKEDPKGKVILASTRVLANRLRSAASSLADLSQLKLEGVSPAVATALQQATDVKLQVDTQLTKMIGVLGNLIRKCQQERMDPLIAPMTMARSALAKAKAATAKKNWLPGNDSVSTQTVQEQLGVAAAALDRMENIDLSYTKPSEARPAKLIQQIFRPDVWFAAPPRCNVIFPDQYTQMSYGVDWLREPTRLLLKTHDEFFGEDELFDNFYFAPKSPTTGSKQRAQLQQILAGDILLHERFVGVLPVFEKMGEFNIFAVRDGKVKGKTPKVGLAQRSANFLYFRRRFAARQLQINSLFDPYLVPGFPCLVIDRPTPYAVVNDYWSYIKQFGKSTRDNNLLLGAHFLGNVAMVQHNLSQTSGTTSIACSFARHWSEGVEFLQSIDPDKDQYVLKRYGKNALRTTDVASLAVPKVGAIGPGYGVITKVQDVTDQYVPYRQFERIISAIGIEKDVLNLPFYRGPRRNGIGEMSVRVPIGIPVVPSTLGEDAVKALGSVADTPLTFRAYRVEEEIPRYRKEKVDLPAEELIRPGWYGDCWHSSKIGEVYEEYFRTGAITDPQQVTDADGANQGVRSLDAPDALALAANGRKLDDPNAQAPAILALDTDSSIEQAVAFILSTYSYIKQNGLNVQAFIDSYKWRPIATIPDMFGSADLELDSLGHKAIRGVEGFHSRAFGPYNDMFGLVTPEVRTIIGIKPGSTASQLGDVRKDRQDAVIAYVTKLLGSRAIMGLSVVESVT